MNPKPILWGGTAVLTVAAAIFAAWVLSLPPSAPAASAPAISAQEHEAAISALKPPKRARPVIAIVGINDATETTDYLMPYGILRRADVGEVLALATGPGPVKLYPVLSVEPDTTVAAFDQKYPQGADYVIVPAMTPDDDPGALAWIRSQSHKGAIVIAVCAGAKVAGAAGLLDGRRATTHWYWLKDLREAHPTMSYVADRRFVVERQLATTTGITASIPMMLTLVESIAGRDKAQAVAQDLGVPAWDARHGSRAFQLTRRFATTVLGNVLMPWNREQIGIDLAPGVDEVSLALVADAWSRTYRSRARTFAASAGPVTTRHGVRVLPDATGGGRGEAVWPAVATNRPPAKALDDTLSAIEQRYGKPTAEVVAMQLEYAAANGQP